MNEFTQERNLLNASIAINALAGHTFVRYTKEFTREWNLTNVNIVANALRRLEIASSMNKFTVHGVKFVKTLQVPVLW